MGVQGLGKIRDESGELLPGAHVLGLLPRVCKLLFLRVRLLIGFDAATPALKRRSVLARRRQRENAQINLRRTAEKLLFNQRKHGQGTSNGRADKAPPRASRPWRRSGLLALKQALGNRSFSLAGRSVLLALKRPMDDHRAFSAPAATDLRSHVAVCHLRLLRPRIAIGLEKRTAGLGPRMVLYWAFYEIANNRSPRSSDGNDLRGTLLLAAVAREDFCCLGRLTLGVHASPVAKSPLHTPSSPSLVLRYPHLSLSLWPNFTMRPSLGAWWCVVLWQQSSCRVQCSGSGGASGGRGSAFMPCARPSLSHFSLFLSTASALLPTLTCFLPTSEFLPLPKANPFASPPSIL
ncbi:unnamed protein product [Closterium sp. NIES-64]|nr:unnamed protein product [Closterium sp. NIES-64]